MEVKKVRHRSKQRIAASWEGALSAEVAKQEAQGVVGGGGEDEIKRGLAERYR